MRVAIIGSRSAEAPEYKSYIFSLICAAVPANCTEIISGGAVGVDTLAADCARKFSLRLNEIKPDYIKFGRSAPIKRNNQIIDSCDLILAFWDGESHGTSYTISRAVEKGVPVRVFNIPKSEKKDD